MKKKLFFSRFTQRVVTSHTHEMCFKSHLGSTFYFFVRSLEQLRQKCSLWRSCSLRQRELSNLVVGFYHQVAFFWQTIENIFTKTTVLRSTLLCFDCEFWSKTFLNSYIGNPIDTVTLRFQDPPSLLYGCLQLILFLQTSVSGCVSKISAFLLSVNGRQAPDEWKSLSQRNVT